ncbi:MAG: pyridoxal phosphate-dependent decarboxylase family protein [Gammaproteobacteria bacterium]
MTHRSHSTLELEPEHMRALGYRVVDMLVEHYTSLPDKPVTGHASRQTMEALLHEPPPELPADPEHVLAQLERDVFPNNMYGNHPRFFAFIPGPSSYIGALGDALASGFNVINALWKESSAATQIELTTIDWLRELCGLPESAGGLFVSGGSVANLTALAAARQTRLGHEFHNAVVYCSEQTHASLSKGLRILGFAPERVIRIEVDQAFRLSMDALTRQVVRDKAESLRPFCVVANAGTTNTGAIDPLPEIAALCKQHGMWFHIDGAYGAAAVLTAEGRRALSGLELADSVAIDPHKWLFQPFEIGCVIVRDARLLPQAFGAEHEYMQDAAVNDGEREINFCDYGIQLSRGFRALKLWMSLKVFGLRAFREAIERGMALAETAEQLLAERSCFEIVTPAQLGIVSFRYLPPAGSELDADSVNAGIVEACIDDGYAMVSSTILRSQTVLRLCTINPRTTGEELRKTVELIARCGDELALS